MRSHSLVIVCTIAAHTLSAGDFEIVDVLGDAIKAEDVDYVLAVSYDDDDFIDDVEGEVVEPSIKHTDIDKSKTTSGLRAMFTDDKEEEAVKAKMRKTFIAKLRADGVTVTKRKSEVLKANFYLVKVPFERLCVEAERASLFLPLKTLKVQDPEPGFFHNIAKHFVTDNEVDYVAMAFTVEKKAYFKGIEHPETFFRTSYRHLLAYDILCNSNIAPESTVQQHNPFVGLEFLLNMVC